MNANSPAYPVTIPTHDGPETSFGLTKREQIASTLHLASDDFDGLDVKAIELLAGPMPAGSWGENPRGYFEWIARAEAVIRVARADALLAELAKSKEGV